MGTVVSAADLNNKLILVIGSDGSIGKHLVPQLIMQGFCVLSTTRKLSTVNENTIYLDLSDYESWRTIPFDRIESAIICASISSIDKCQLNPQATRIINIENTASLAKILFSYGIFVVYLSSNSVFDGKAEFAKCTDLCYPMTEYGRQKVETERALMRLCRHVSIIRFSKVISQDMPLINGWINDLTLGKLIYPFADSVMSPISVVLAVELIIHVVKMKISGITQLSASYDITYYQAAKYIAEKLRLDFSLIRPVFYKDKGITYSPNHTTLHMSLALCRNFAIPPPTKALDQFM